jgi:hypothetical protein
VRESSLLHGAAVGIEWRRTFQVRRRIFQPHQPAFVQMREDGPNRSPTAFLTRRLRAPGTRIEVREDELVHRIIARVSFQQGIANLSKRRKGLHCHKSSAKI